MAEKERSTQRGRDATEPAFIVPTIDDRGIGWLPWDSRYAPRFVLATASPDYDLLIEQSSGGDKYRGTAEQLIAAGLVTAGTLPGDPGRNKIMQSVTADGRAINANSNESRDAGTRSITKDLRKRERGNLKSQSGARRKKDGDATRSMTTTHSRQLRRTE